MPKIDLSGGLIIDKSFFLKTATDGASLILGSRLFLKLKLILYYFSRCCGVPTSTLFRLACFLSGTNLFFIIRTVINLTSYLRKIIINFLRYFSRQNISAIVCKIMKGQYAPISEHYSQELKRLIDSLLHLEPTRRPNVNKIMAQPVVINPLLDLSTDIGRVPYKL